MGKMKILPRPGRVSPLKLKALKRDNYTCQGCGCTEKEVLQVDHKVERANNGPNTLDNLQTLCANCHMKKTVKFLKLRVKSAIILTTKTKPDLPTKKTSQN